MSTHTNPDNTPNTNPNPVPSGENASVPPARPKPPKQIYPLERRDWIFAALLPFGTLFTVIAGVWGGFQAGFTAAYLVIFALFTAYLARRGAKAGAYAAVCGVLAVLLSAVYTITSGTAIRFFALCLMAVLSVVWFSSLAGKRMFPGELGLAKRVLWQTGFMIERTPRSVASLFGTKNPHAKKAAKALLGLLCAAPVLGVVIALLIRSDAAFEGLMGRMFSNVGVTIVQIILTLILFPFLLSFGFSTRKDADEAQKEKTRKGLDTLFIAAFLGVLAVCYLVYLVSQLAYFFSAFSGILPEGFSFSYAEYARRGFFELCGIAGINLALLYLMLLLSKKTDGKPPVVLRVLGVFIDLFTLLLICTAEAKMVLYIRAYGVTVKRLGTSAFMLLMAVVFLAMLLRFFVSRVRVLPVAVVTAAVIVLVLGAGNMHTFAARYNYNAYKSGTLSTVDTAYLRKLGDEGIPYLAELTKDGNAEIRRQAYAQLCIAVEERYEGEYEFVPKGQVDTSYFSPAEKSAGKLTQFSIPRRRAYAALDALLQEQPDFLRTYAADRDAAMGEEFFW